MEKQSTLIRKISRLGLVLALVTGFSQQNLHSQSFTFTPCGATGQFGPTQGLVNTAYQPTNLNGMVTVLTQGLQLWTVPATGNYRIHAWGAQGGPNWGLGAYVAGDVNLTAGTVLKIAVGQTGGSSNSSHGSGGGGSFVATNANVPIMVAGGGGGKGASSSAVQAHAAGGIATNGQSPPGGGPGGTGGGGGASASGLTGGTPSSPGAPASGSTWASGGGGFITDGGLYQSNALQGGRSFMNNALGGDPAASGGNSPGGFGGGGGCGDRGAGGGGYSGGGGGTNNAEDGGGGGSYNSGTNQVNTAGINAGMGRVVITPLCNISLATPVNPICIGATITLTTDAASGILWSSGSNANSISVSPSVTTTYSVTGTSTANCIAGSFITVTVNPLPVLSAVVSPTMLCVGNTATVTASGAATYTWNNGPTGISLTANPGVTTIYNLSGTSQFGCLNSAQVTVNVNSNSLTVNSTTAVCLGSAVNLVASGAVTYTWSNGSNFATVPVTPGQSTTYTINAIDNYGCALSNQVAVTVNPKPTVGGSTNKPMACKWDMISLIGTGATTYTWSNGSTGTPVQVSVPVDVIYTFTVTGTDNNGCTNTAIVNVNVNKCVGIDEQGAPGSAARVYPNPVTSELTVELNNGSGKSVAIIDLTGRLVLSRSGQDGKMSIDLSSFSAGVYYVKVTSADRTETFKIIKNN